MIYVSDAFPAANLYHKHDNIDNNIYHLNHHQFSAANASLTLHVYKLTREGDKKKNNKAKEHNKPVLMKKTNYIIDRIGPAFLNSPQSSDTLPIHPHKARE